MARPDPHSSFDDAQPRLRRLDWRARVDFGARTLVAEARLQLEGAGELVDLDARDLTIERVTDEDGARLDVELGAPHPFLGQRLRIARPRGLVCVRYHTAPGAMALHWSNQSVYSQCQPIYARSLVPLPDSPSSRLAYSAELTAPRGLTALMAARRVGRVESGDEATTSFAMDEPIAPYLLALAVGDFEARELSPRSRVWAAPALVEQAARELADVERMLAAAEQLFGRYRWARFDLLIAPPSFPYGGMENPQLAFVSPTLLGADRAIVAVVAHELAHAWSGNLVTAASAEHFWLNEAFTVWAERRILAAVDGEAAAQRHAMLGRRDLDRALAAFAAQPERTRLRLSLDGIDPDEGLSLVPYEKGYLMLCALEEELGPGPFAELVRAYFDQLALRSITSEAFVAFAAARAPGFAFAEWLNQSGLPAGVAPPSPSPTSLPAADEARRYSPDQWRWLLDGLPRPFADCATLQDWFNQFPPASPDVRASWLALALESDWAPAVAAAEAALGDGRIKQLRPIYLALLRRPATRELAGRLYRRFRDGYHPIARQQLERLFRELGVATQEVKPMGLGGLGRRGA